MARRRTNRRYLVKDGHITEPNVLLLQSDTDSCDQARNILAFITRKIRTKIYLISLKSTKQLNETTWVYRSHNILSCGRITSRHGTCSHWSGRSRGTFSSWTFDEAKTNLAASSRSSSSSSRAPSTSKLSSTSSISDSGPSSSSSASSGGGRSASHAAQQSASAPFSNVHMTHAQARRGRTGTTRRRGGRACWDNIRSCHCAQGLRNLKDFERRKVPWIWACRTFHRHVFALHFRMYIRGKPMVVHLVHRTFFFNSIFHPPGKAFFFSKKRGGPEPDDLRVNFYIKQIVSSWIQQTANHKLYYMD